MITVLIHLLYLLGLACAVYGVWLIYHPAGWVVGGVLLVVFAMLIDRETREPDESR